MEPLPDQLGDVRVRVPVSKMITDELGEQVGRTVSSLPPRQREVVVLRLYEGLSTRETALLLETTEENVRMNLHHARQALRRRLRPLLEDNET